MFDRICVPTDGSDAAAAAFEHTLAIAADHGATVHLLHVADTTRDSVTRIGGDVVDVLEQEGESIVEEAAARAADRGVDAETAVRQGGVPETVVERARSVVESADRSQAESGPEEGQPTASVDHTPTESRPDSRSETKPDRSGTTTDSPNEQTGAVDNDRPSYPEESLDVGAEAADDRASYPEEEFFGGTADPAADDPLDEESMVRVAVALRSVDVASMTPLEALNTLDELRSTLEASRSR